MTLGFVGLGKMGAVMAARLIAAGYELVVWNRSPAPAEQLLAAGASRAETPAQVADAASIVITMISDDDAAKDVYRSTQGLFANPVQGRLFMDMSTLRPDTMRSLSAQAGAMSATFLDAPVMGTVAPAANGQLVALVGGQARDLDRARPVLDILCRKIIHAGPAGHGALLKLVVNLPLAVYWQALGEAVAMGRAGGLSLELILDAVGQSGGALAALPLKSDAISDPEAHVAFDVNSMAKDLAYIVETATHHDVLTPTASDSLARYEALAAKGRGKADAVAVVTDTSEPGEDM